MIRDIVPVPVRRGQSGIGPGISFPRFVKGKPITSFDVVHPYTWKTREQYNNMHKPPHTRVFGRSAGSLFLPAGVGFRIFLDPVPSFVRKIGDENRMSLENTGSPAPYLDADGKEKPYGYSPDDPRPLPVAEIRGIYYWYGSQQYRPVAVKSRKISEDAEFFQYQTQEGYPEDRVLKSSLSDLWSNVFIAIRFKPTADGLTTALVGKKMKVEITYDNADTLDVVNQNMRKVTEDLDYPGSVSTILIPFELPASPVMEGGQLFISPSGREPGYHYLVVKVSDLSSNPNDPVEQSFFIRIV